MSEQVSLDDAVALLLGFLSGAPLTEVIASLERAVDGKRSDEAAAEIDAAGIGARLFEAAVVTRDNLGRLNDLIHAVGISLAIPHVLEPGERITNRPSLAAGNDPSRPYDLETDHRVAEFKFGVWTGRDAMRKRQAFKDLVNLAADDSGRRRCLYVIGQRPIRFQRTSGATASWGLDRTPATREVFKERFGDLSTSVCEFVATYGARVEVMDLVELVPDVFGGM